MASRLSISGLGLPGDGYHQGIFVSSGGRASNISVGSSGFFEVQSGASASAVTATGAGAGLELVGGVMSALTIGSGASLYDVGGTLVGATIDSGSITGSGTVSGTLLVAAGALDTGETLLSGSVETVQAAGVVSAVTVNSGAVLSGAGTVSGGLVYGAISGLHVSGSVDIGSGGVANALSISGLNLPGPGYHQGIFVSSGGRASNSSTRARPSAW